MKKLTFAITCLLAMNSAFAQKAMTRTGEIKFEASMPTFEEIAGTNNTASAILDLSNGDFVALALIKAFKFKSPLMEEHFNENYMESSKFPKATFKGKITGFDATKLSAAKALYDAEGDLTIHGVTKKIHFKVALAKNGAKITAAGTFNVKAADYNIDIPSIVKSKISEDIKVTVNLMLEEK